MLKNSLTHEPAGYWHKPQLIKLLALGYIAFPLLFWWQMGNGSAVEGSGIAGSSIFLQELFCALTAAIALLWVTKPSLFYLIFLSAYFLTVKLFGFLVHTPDSRLEVLWTVFWFAAPATLLLSQAKLPYLYPERRWWKRPDRHLHPTGGQMLVHGIKFPLVVLNVSDGGAFVKLDERIFQEGTEESEERRHDGAGRFPTVNQTERFIALRNMHEYPKMGDVISVAIETLEGLDSPFKKNRLVTLAEVVWVTKATDPYQYGLGLKFTKLSFMNRTRLRRYLKLLPAKTVEIPPAH